MTLVVALVQQSRIYRWQQPFCIQCHVQTYQATRSTHIYCQQRQKEEKSYDYKHNYLIQHTR